jgi:predicted nucleic acid-binding protein
MAGFRTYTVVLDACVLYPATLRDLLLSLACENVYRARWTQDIQDEWIRNVLAKRQDLDEGKLRRTQSLMADAIDDCIIDGYQNLIDGLQLPDPNDRHVLAAAIVGHADAIVSFNKKDFPEAILAKYGIELLHPDDFILLQYDLNAIGVLEAVKAMRSRLKNPPKTVQEFLDRLEQQGLPQTCLELRKASNLI